MKAKKERPKIGLALGGGGAKGLAHIGVIKVLEKNNIPIDFIAGTSIGSLIGGLYAFSKDIKKVEETALFKDKLQIINFLMDPSIHGGFITGNKIEKFIKERINDTQFSKLKIPFISVATELTTGKGILLKKGSVADAIRASISFPLIFEPMQFGTKVLADGGLSHPVPVDIVKKMGADIVIGVNLGAHSLYRDTDNRLGLHDAILYTISALRYNLGIISVKDADIIIEPNITDVNVIGWKNFLHGKTAIKKGERATQKAIFKLKELIKNYNK
ncbi:MAG: patatin-like phospholipase family protein [Patescibacteria group bacterium]|nr:patatin-like phospholipase family protein [Patescibacteria group bacterium]